MLILKAVSLAPLHGYGILLRIQQISGDVLSVPQGSLYPALYRLVAQRFLTAHWGQSENNRRARYYSLTKKGAAHLRKETLAWNEMTAAIAAALNARPEEV